MDCVSIALEIDRPVSAQPGMFEIPPLSGEFDLDVRVFSKLWRDVHDRIGRLPEKPARTDAEAKLAHHYMVSARNARVSFLSAHAATLYRRATANLTKFVYIDEVISSVRSLVPGLVPSAQLLEADAGRAQAHKEGYEIDEGLLLNHIIADPAAGTHFCHGHLLPRPESIELLPRYVRSGRVDLGGATLERIGEMSVVTLQNTRFLNAEDDSTLDALEFAVDLALMDRASRACILRGARVAHRKYEGQRIFGSGINLTHLYEGKIPFRWYIKRECGFVNKMYRGLASTLTSPDEITGETLEKPWVAQVDGFAIGGACQLLLVCDYVVASDRAYMTLPARKEGIVPGFANGRLWRFVGDRIARQAIQSERRIECASDEGLRVCDEVVPAGQTEAAAIAAADRFLESGAVSAVANRRGLRIGQETLDQFRQYLAFYARAEADCHFSPQLIGNLERFWTSRNRAA